MAADVTISIDSPACDEMLLRYGEPWLEAKVDSIAMEAIDRCPVGVPDPLGRPREWPKHMRDCISSYVQRVGTGLVGWVWVETPYAKSVILGARPHEIRPKGNYPLRFVMPKAGGAVVRTRRVRHPGNAANPFLPDAMRHVISASPGR